MRISDWSSDVCSSDLFVAGPLSQNRIEPHAEEGGDHGEQDDRKSGHGQKSNTDPMRVEESRVLHRRCAAMFQIPMAAASRQVNVRQTSKVRRATFPAAPCAARPPLLTEPQPPVPPENGAWARQGIPTHSRESPL